MGKPAVLIAGAGSGKTRVLTERVRWLIEQGVMPRRICAITFTNKAANEMKDRLGIGINTPMDKEPRVSTIHSLALSGIRKNPKAFGFGDHITPMDEYDQLQLMKKVIERYDDKHRHSNPRGNGFTYSVLEKIGFHRARGVGFRDDYTDAVHDRALSEHAGYHAMTEEYLDLWELFEDEKRKINCLDFDDMLWMFNKRARTDKEWLARVQGQFDHVLVDEAQDLSPVQWEFVNHLLAPSNLNLYAVGDMGQCQPPGTQISIVTKQSQMEGMCQEAQWATKDISELKTGALAVSWGRRNSDLRCSGRTVNAVASRFYSGPLIVIESADFKTRVTPNHWLWVKFNDLSRSKHIVYLMQRDDLGFRVGTTALRKGKASGLAHRMWAEQATRGWIIKVCESRSEAQMWEEIISLKYGIPETIFEPSHTRKFNTIQPIFAVAKREGGFACLVDHGLLFEFPLVIRDNSRRLEFSRKWTGFCRVAACNLLSEIMDIPNVAGARKDADGHRVSGIAPISKITREHYEGLVHSLDVDKDHTYIADGLIVENSIYGFNGAVPKILKDFSEGWREQVPVLYKIKRNHRSMRKIVHLANKIQRTMTETIPLEMEVFREEDGDWRLFRASLPQNCAEVIAQQIKNDSSRRQSPVLFKENAILVRSGLQVRDLEGELVRRRIPYVVRGGRGLLQTEEVRDILAYLRLVSNRKDFTAFMRCCSVPRCGVGEVALNKLRIEANQRFSGDLLEAAKENERLHNLVGIIDMVAEFRDMPITAVEKLLALFDYRRYAREKYKKDPDKVRTKLENVERFVLMVQSLTIDTSMTLDDLIFQLALDRTKGDETEKAMYDRQLASGELTQKQHDQKMEEMRQGAVTISTIHCSPPDEPVLTAQGNKLISKLDPSVDGLYSYMPKCNQLARGKNNQRQGYGFSVKTRPYSGDLIVISTAESRTRVTPEHRIRVSFHDNFYDKWVVYLMRRGDWWRIGVCSSAHKPYRSGGVKGRLATEKADCAWILGVFDTKEAALAAEVRYQVGYGIPSVCFEKWHHKITSEQLHTIHEDLRPTVFPRAMRLLADKGLLIDAPLFRRENKRWIMLNGNWFDTVAANLLDGYMFVPVALQSDFDYKAPTSPRPLQAKIEREHYEGPVFSLDVPPHKYYISGGIVVHNSAKGLEWPRVYVTNVYEGSLPNRFCIGSDEEIEEERRLFYVACTRAKDALVLCLPEKVPVNGTANVQRVAPSRFLKEIDALPKPAASK